MDRQTLRDWVHRYNDVGSGLVCPTCRGATARGRVCRPNSRPRWRNGSSKAQNYELDGVVRWRCIDLQLRIAQAFGVQLHERTVGKLLRTAVVSAAVGASAAPAEQSRGPSGFQRSFADLVTAAVPPEAARQADGDLVHR